MAEEDRPPPKTCALTPSSGSESWTSRAAPGPGPAALAHSPTPHLGCPGAGSLCRSSLRGAQACSPTFKSTLRAGVL